MKLFRYRLVRLPIITIGAVAWLAVSNHCALAALERPAMASMPSCHEMAPTKQAPAKHDHEGSTECCKVLRATLLSSSKDISFNITTVFVPFAYIVGVVIPPVESRISRTFEWDTGPPGSESFAELVLQRSLLAHAPPLALS